MITLLSILLGFACLLLIIAGIAIINLLKQTEQLDDMVAEIKLATAVQIAKTLDKMNAIDLKGAFKSDDEVGAVFGDLKNLIEELNKSM